MIGPPGRIDPRHRLADPDRKSAIAFEKYG